MKNQYGPKMFRYVVTMAADPDKGTIIKGGMAALVLFISFMLLILDTFPRPYNWSVSVFVVVFSERLAAWKGNVWLEKANSETSPPIHPIAILYWVYYFILLSTGIALMAKVAILITK